MAMHRHHFCKHDKWQYFSIVNTNEFNVNCHRTPDELLLKLELLN